MAIYTNGGWILASAYDWLVFATAATAALGTLLAVVVALFGPSYQQGRLRPVVTLEIESEGREMLYDALGETELDSGPGLRVRNAPRRATAREVEVGVTIASPFEGGHVPLVEDRRLNFIDPTTSTEGSPIAHVPPGGSRRVYLVTLGPSRAISAQLAPAASGARKAPVDVRASLALAPARQDAVEWLTDGEYLIWLTVTGANFDATIYKGRFAITSTNVGELALDSTAKMKRAVSVSFEWMQLPRVMGV
jgi:hypothetical protein